VHLLDTCITSYLVTLLTMRFSTAALASALLASSALAVPLLPGLPNPFAPPPPTTDAPFSLSQAELDSKLSCPGADKNNLNGKKPILLVSQYQAS
jgi:hypothetical protein